MYEIITEPNKEFFIGTKYWKNHACAVAYCHLLNQRLPNIFFGVRPVNDKYLSTKRDHE